MKKRIGIQGFLMFAALAATVLFSRFLLPDRQGEFLLDEILNAAGIALVTSGFLLRVAARGYKADLSASGASLITGGAYALMRNPMYLGTLLVGIGVGLSVFLWWVPLAFCFIYLLIYMPQIRKEENALLGRFGQDYRRYCLATPRFFPDPLALFRKGARSLFFFRWRWVKKELPSVIGVAALIVGARVLNNLRLSGRTEYKKEVLNFLLFPFLVFLITLLFCEKENIPEKI